MAKHPERTQKTGLVDAGEDGKALDIKPLTGLGDRRRNPRDIEPDVAAMRNGVEHGGTIETRAQGLSVRGSGGRKRSGARGRYKAGRDISKHR
jgi:hypothetical protein